MLTPVDLSIQQVERQHITVILETQDRNDCHTQEVIRKAVIFLFLLSDVEHMITDPEFTQCRSNSYLHFQYFVLSASSKVAIL